VVAQRVSLEQDECVAGLGNDMHSIGDICVYMRVIRSDMMLNARAPSLIVVSTSRKALRLVFIQRGLT
jgi:hypothetical protein